MKKRVLSIAFVAALLAIMVSGTLAYFTAEDQVKNTFTFGSIEIEIYENGQPTESDTIPFGKLLPIVDTANPSKDVSYMKKVVEVKNIGENDAYIRTLIAIPTQLVGYLQLELDETGWTQQADSTATVGNIPYTVFTYDYDTAVTPDTFTNVLLKGVYLGANVDVEADANGDLQFILRDTDGKKTDASGFTAHKKNADGTYTSAVVEVLVASQAIQTVGFKDGPTAALNSGFPGNPWQ